MKEQDDDMPMNPSYSFTLVWDVWDKYGVNRSVTKTVAAGTLGCADF